MKPEPQPKIPQVKNFRGVIFRQGEETTIKGIAFVTTSFTKRGVILRPVKQQPTERI